MAKGLGKKLGIGGLTLLAGLGLNSCDEKYIIEGYKTKYNSGSNDIRISKGKDNIWYNGEVDRNKENINNDSLENIQINLDYYFPEDTLIYPDAAEMFKYLKQKIREKKREEGLEIIKRTLEEE